MAGKSESSQLKFERLLCYTCIGNSLSVATILFHSFHNTKRFVTLQLLCNNLFVSSPGGTVDGVTDETG